MSSQQIATIDATANGSGVVLDSTHSELALGEDGTWAFTIRKQTPAEVVFHLQPVDAGGCQRVVRSHSRTEPDEPWGPWEDWALQQGVHVSPTFGHGHEFELEAVLCTSASRPPTAGGFFRVRDEGSGDG